MEGKTPLQKASPAFRRILFEGKVTSLLPSAAVTSPVSSSIATIIRLMDVHNVGCIPLVDASGSLSGVISERDILRLVANYSEIKNNPIETIMTKPVQTLPSYGSVARALYFMVAGGYRHLPITGLKLPNAGKVSNLGVISIKNVAAYLNKSLGGKITGSSELSDMGDDLIQLFSAPLSSLSPQKAFTLPTSASVLDAALAMNAHHTGSVLVTGERDRVKGIFTERDLICRVISPGLSPQLTPLEAAMTPRPRTMTAGSSIALALESFSSGKYRHLPVVDDEENLLGVLSLKDFIKALTTEVLRELGA